MLSNTIADEAKLIFETAKRIEEHVNEALERADTTESLANASLESSGNQNSIICIEWEYKEEYYGIKKLSHYGKMGWKLNGGVKKYFSFTL